MSIYLWRYIFPEINPQLLFCWDRKDNGDHENLYNYNDDDIDNNEKNIIYEDDINNNDV